MKYIALVIVLALMGWTWSMANSERDFALADSRDMENQFEAIVREYVQTHRPTAKDIRFQQLYTEVVRPNEEMRIHMRYTIDDETQGGDDTEQSYQGTVVLKSNDGKTWSWVSQDIKSPSIEFKNGLRISPKDPLPDEAPATEGEGPAAAPTAPAPEAADHDDHH